VDVFGSQYFPVTFTSQSKISGVQGLSRSLDLILRVSRGGNAFGRLRPVLDKGWLACWLAEKPCSMPSDGLIPC
jgi:hypothetical protein